jgi:hypothetical protein
VTLEVNVDAAAGKEVNDTAGIMTAGYDTSTSTVKTRVTK